MALIPNVSDLDQRLRTLETKVREMETVLSPQKRRGVPNPATLAQHVSIVKLVIITEVHRFAAHYLPEDESRAVSDYMLKIIDPANDAFNDDFWLKTQNHDINWWITRAKTHAQDKLGKA
jgi:hypothetical protein